jgi:signal transduction histidine kinase
MIESRPGPAGTQRAAIRLRFTALYAATILLLLLGAAVATRQALRATLQHEFDESVRASAALVSQFFRTEIAEYRSIEATLTHISGELVFEDRAVHIRRPDDSHFGDSVSMPRRARLAVATPIREVRFPLDPALAPGWDIEVHASMANLQALRRRIDRWFAVGIPAFVALAAVAGWWLTGRTLRPVGEMARAAERIAPASGVRLPVANPRDELGRLGEQFNALLDRLDEAILQQRRFLADAAHELRTPLARMRARVELAQLRARAAEPVLLTGGRTGGPATGDESATWAGDLAGLEAELRAMTQQVDELLQLARADAGGEEPMTHASALFLDDLVADELPRWQPQAQRLRATLVVGELEETPVRGDPVLLARLCGVLVDNAFRYGGEPGIVRVALQAAGGAARLTVEDNGPGVPSGDHGRIFERFYRGEEARHRRADGSGLGLAIADFIVRRHGGTIAVGRSGLGGACFEVCLPLDHA